MRGEHLNSDDKPWHNTRGGGGNKRSSSSGRSERTTELLPPSSSQQDLLDVVNSIAGRRVTEAVAGKGGVNESSNSSGFGVEDSFLVAMSREIEDMKREEEQHYMRDKVELVGRDSKQLNYVKSINRSSSNSGKGKGE